ncbi:ornithine--oxo-acid transaminase [Agromyces sp. SYSU T00194]|uniref:ornithine--oxo-acid transaminase n=1 Tax=Agromyces chitinivorans TaxID=3158560 RepID=UPI003393B70C
MIHTAENATEAAIALEEAHAAHNYHPLPVVVASGEGAWVTDVEGRRYLDCLAAYSAVNFGHGHPQLVAAAHAQLDRITLTSRAFHNDRLGPFVTELAELVGMDMVLPMNTGAEAVESAIKVARAWGYRVKGVPTDAANIVVMAGNFHGRTTTIVSFSDDPDARADFGPFTPGFRAVPYGDADAAADAIDANTVAVLVEPIQGEAGIVVPPADFLPRVRELCDANGVLLIADEIQSGLGRTGSTLACDLVGVRPDLVTLGKALGGGIVPVSAVVGSADVLGVLRPGEHGSTFGGNPLAAAVGLEVVRLLASGEPQARARDLGARLRARLDALVGRGVVAVRGAGLWAGIDIDPALGTGREVCEALMRRGVLAKDTHGSTIRLAPPIVVEASDLDWAVDQLEAVLAELAG